MEPKRERSSARAGSGKKTQKAQSRPANGGASEDLPAHIARRAYELYLARGSRDGYALEDWLQAEREVLSREPRV